jgi:hypothetical protein
MIEIASWRTPGDFKGCIEVKSFLFEPKPEVPRDTPVWVRDWDDENWKRAYATGDFTDDGKILCYSGGLTSFTIDHEDDCWPWTDYSLTDPT